MLELVPRAAYLLVNAAAVYVIMSPPNPPPKKQELSRPNTMSEVFIQLLGVVNKFVMWASTVCEFVALFCASISRNPPALLCPNASGAGPFSMGDTDYPVVFGGILSGICALWRLWCYRTMGHQYTFEVAITRKHQLAAVLFSPGGWLVRCEAWRGVGALVWIPWTVNVGVMMHGIAKRPQIEDDNLRRIFKDQWVSYAKRVPYRLIPGVL
ncbi:hypothetical protein BD779DRAFT_1519331 [Infundibulicybe gibba]|nr:hypothetical protein BD779DRAFT_1519331 [Infundibulicybe gibba]